MKKKVKFMLDFIVVFIILFVSLVFASFIALSKSFDMGNDYISYWPSDKFILYEIAKENVQVNFINVIIVSVVASLVISIGFYLLRRIAEKYLIAKGMN